MSSACKTETDELQLHSEEVSVSRRELVGDTIRVSTVAHEKTHLVDEVLAHERVEIERVPIGRTVDARPPVREEGDTTIMSVVEEIVVVERRLILKEEVRIRRVRVNEHYRKTVVVREQDAVITRAEAGPPTVEDRRSLGTESSNYDPEKIK